MTPTADNLLKGATDHEHAKFIAERWVAFADTNENSPAAVNIASAYLALRAENERLKNAMDHAIAANTVWRSHPSHGDCQACEQYQAALEIE